jgi:hypothetical protein
MSSLPPIPTYRIDLSLPPALRYQALATDLSPQMKELTPIFDTVLSIVIPWRKTRYAIEWLASLLLRRVFSDEESQELRGIAEASGVPMYFLVALNVLLDSLLGCTSGGALVVPRNSKRKRFRRGSGENVEEELRDRMMHFRTLDWDMDGLRSVLVVLEFVKSKSAEPEKVLARSITYAGFVGCLTGVRYVPNCSLTNTSTELRLWKEKNSQSPLISVQTTIVPPVPSVGINFSSSSASPIHRLSASQHTPLTTKSALGGRNILRNTKECTVLPRSL